MMWLRVEYGKYEEVSTGPGSWTPSQVCEWWTRSAQEY